ncbi:MAG: TIR domain-containing protein [Chromatiaceae bacterium]|jgi:tetratricopeptide (TPR) repeat protein
MTTSNAALATREYLAFISYRHADNKQQGRQWATWLHQALETYEVPADLVGKTNSRGEVIPERIYPIFRDEDELPAHADLANSITSALANSRLLVVLCSPNAVASTYVADEIRFFKKLGHSDRIIAAMIDGEPNASWDTSKHSLGFTADDECFPIPLQFEYDQDGNPTDKHAEPIAADFRINNDGKPEEGFTTPAAYREHLKATTQHGNKTIDKKVDSYQQQLQLTLLKIIAGILGIPLGELIQRDKEYQLKQERLKAKKLIQWLGAVAMLAIVAIGAGVVAYFQKLQTENLLKQVSDNISSINWGSLYHLHSYAVPNQIIDDITYSVESLVEASKEVESPGSIASQLDYIATYINKVKAIKQNNPSDINQANLFLNKASGMLESIIMPEDVMDTVDISFMHNQLGDLNIFFGNAKEALIHYHAGLELNKAIEVYFPEMKDHEIHINVCESHGKLGDVYLNLGNIEKALTHYQEILLISNTLSKNTPNYAEAILYISIAKTKLGDLQLTQGNRENALKYYKEAVVIGHGLANKYTDYSYAWEIQRGFALASQKLGDLQLSIGNVEQALVHFESVLAVEKGFVVFMPEHIQYQLNLSLAHKKVADVQLQLKKTDSALENYNSGKSIVQALGMLMPKNIHFRTELSSFINRLGRLHLRSSSTSEALQEFQNSILILKGFNKSELNNEQLQEQIVQYSASLAHAYILSGEYETAKNIYKKYKGFKFENGDVWDEFIIADFKALGKDGITHPDFASIVKEVFGVDLDAKPEIQTKEAA